MTQSETSSLTGSWVKLNHISGAIINLPTIPMDETNFSRESKYSHLAQTLDIFGYPTKNKSILDTANLYRSYVLNSKNIQKKKHFVKKKRFPKTPPNTPTIRSEPPLSRGDPNSLGGDTFICNRPTIPTFTCKEWHQYLTECHDKRKLYTLNCDYPSPNTSSWTSVDQMLKQAIKDNIPFAPNAKPPSEWSSPLYPASPYPEGTILSDENLDTDWIWDWSNGNAQFMDDPILFDYKNESSNGIYNVINGRLRNSKFMKFLLFSPEIPWILITNLFSLALGTSIGIIFGIHWYNTSGSS